MQNLGDILTQTNLITDAELARALELQDREGKKLGEVLVEQSLITADTLAMALSIQLNIPLIDLKRHTVQPRALQMIPEETARKHTLIPLDVVGNSLVVVMSDPTDIQTIEDLQVQSKLKVDPALGIPADIQEAIDINYRASTKIEKQVSQFAPSKRRMTQSVKLDISSQTPVTQTVDLIIDQAITDRASDVHIEPQETRLRVRYRIDGILHDATSLPLSVHGPLVARLKIMAGLNIAEHRRPQDGQFRFSIRDKTVDIRAATAETAWGERVTLRILDKEVALISLEKLGFSADVYQKYHQMLKSSFGMILVGGPTGSGKTTTLYASINQLDRNERNIMTIEDPVEYHFTDINQLHVNVKAGLTFATGLRSLMRHDPDVILVGEIRDGETANIAGQAALTGHLVFSSVHANDSVGTLFRLTDLGVERYLISSTIVGVITQRMIRRVCPHCKMPFQPSPEEVVAYQSEMGEEAVEFFHGVGCSFCRNTGYLGRIGVFEVFIVSETIRQMLVKQSGASEIRAQALSEGLVTMRHDGMQKVKEGITTPSEVLRGVFSISQ